MPAIDFEPLSTSTSKVDFEPLDESTKASQIDFQPLEESKPPQSPTPASDKALSETPVSPVDARLASFGVDTVAPESFYSPDQFPVPVQKAAQAIVNVVPQFIPRSFGAVASLATPVVQAGEEIGKTYQMVKDWVNGAPIDQTVKKNFPESQILAEADKTPAGSQERYNAAAQILAQIGMAAGIVRGGTNAKPISETAPIHGDVLDTTRPQEGAGPLPAPESGPGVQTRGQGQIVAHPPQETAQPVGVTETLEELKRRNIVTPGEVRVEKPSPIEPLPVESAIANKYTVERINSGDLGPITPGKVSTVQELATLGQKLVNQGADVDAAVSRVMSGTFDPVNDASIVRFEESRLRARKNAAYRGLQADPQNVEKQLAYENAFKDLTDFHQGPIATVKTNWAQAGRGLQGSFPVDLTTADGLREAWLQNTGVDAPESVKPVMEKVANRVRYSIDQENGVKAKLSSAIEDAYNKRKTKVTHDQIRDRFLKELEARPCQ